MKRSADFNKQLTENKKRAIMLAQQLGVAGALSAKQHKGFTSKVIKGGVDLVLVVEDVVNYNAVKAAKQGKSAENNIDNFTLRFHCVQPTKEELENMGEGARLYADEETGEQGLEIDVRLDNDVKMRANVWNQQRTSAKATKLAELIKAGVPVPEASTAAEEQYGTDIVVPEKTPVMRFPFTSSGFINLVKEDKCGGIKKLLDAKKGDIVRIKSWQASMSVRKTDDFKKYEGAKHEYPTALRMYWSAASVTLLSIPDETVIHALKIIDESEPGVENPHVTHWLPKLTDLVAAAEVLDRSTLGPYTMRFTWLPDYERTANESGMMSRLSITETKMLGDQVKSAFLSGKPGLSCPTLDMLAQITQWRQPSEEERVTEAFDPNKSEGWQYCIRFTAYSKPMADPGKRSTLAACPISETEAWDALAKYFCEGLECFLKFNINVETSASMGENVELADRFAEARGEDRFKEYFYSLQVYPEAIYIDWVALAKSNCIPVSMKGAQKLMKNDLVHSPLYAKLNDPRNLCVALNEIPEDAMHKYWANVKQENGKPKYSFWILAPVDLDETRREVYAELARAYEEGYDGPLGEVLLNESYKPVQAEMFHAHDILKRSGLVRVPINGAKLKKSVYLLAIDEEKYAMATSPMAVNKCLKQQFGFSLGGEEEQHNEEQQPPPLPPQEAPVMNGHHADKDDIIGGPPCTTYRESDDDEDEKEKSVDEDNDNDDDE